MSAFRQKRTNTRLSRHVRLVPIATERSAAKKSPLNHLVGAGEQHRRHVERNSQIGSYGISAPAPPQCALMPANLITLAHFSVSSAMSFPKSAGEPKSGVPPRSASLAFILGSARAALLVALTTLQRRSVYPSAGARTT